MKPSHATHDTSLKLYRDVGASRLAVRSLVLRQANRENCHG
jgi:hypothetical protein